MVPSRSCVTDRPNPRSLRFVPAHAPQVPGIGYSNNKSYFKNKGDHFGDGNNHHGTNRVGSVYNIHRKKKDTKVTKKVERNKSPFRASKDGTKKHHSPKAAEEGLLNSFYKENECKTAKSS